jgi:hypothetical protein
MNERGALICISQRPQRIELLEIDKIMYGWRHLVAEFLLQSKRLPPYRAPHGQDRYQFLRNDPRLRCTAK